MSLSYLGAGDTVAGDPCRDASSEGHSLAGQHNDDEFRYVDPSVLKNLEEQLRSRETALRFAQDYVRLWARRQHLLEAAVESRDRTAALDAVLSLKVSSAMVGAVRLARLTEKLELVVRGKDDLQGTRPLLALAAEMGSATVKELQDNHFRKND